MKKEKLTYIKPKDRKDWLEIRRSGIGGSDAAVIVNLNKYRSPYLLWLDKLGQLEEVEQNEAMRQGSDLEAYVAKRFTEETGKRVRRRAQVIKNPKYPWALANVDRWIIGENAGLECKTINKQYWQQFEDGEFPSHYYIQCLHYMAITGADKYYLAVLVYQEGFHVFEFTRDEEAIADLMQAEEAFWEYVKTETPPPVDGSKATEEALRIQYKDKELKEDSIVLYGLNEEADRLEELKNEKKRISKEIATIEQDIKSNLGEYTVGETDRFSFSWKPQVYKKFLDKELAKDYPDIDLSKYYSESVRRVFRSKKLKGRK